MPSVAFLTYDFAQLEPTPVPNGCAYYRGYLPMLELRRQGWTAVMGIPGWHEEEGYGLMLPDGRALHGFDVIVFKLIMLDFIAEQMDKAKALGQTIVVDIDDFHDGLTTANLAYHHTNPDTNTRNNLEHYKTIIDKADAVIVSTPFLEAHYKAQGKKVYLVRNGIDLGRYKPRKDHSRWLPTVGWIGATPWRNHDLEIMKPWFGTWMRDHYLPFHHAGHIKGAPKAADQLGLRHMGTVEPMRMITDYPSMFRKIDIGLVPLNPIPFNDAKSCIKGLEYAAAGVPFIASPSPEYVRLAEMGIGRIATTPDEWQYHLEELCDPSKRAGDRERNLANLSSHTTEKTYGGMPDVLLEIISTSTGAQQEEYEVIAS